MESDGNPGGAAAAHDLGGLPVPGGRTAAGRFLRLTSDDLAAGTPAGSLTAVVSTAVDLTGLDERMPVVLPAEETPLMATRDADAESLFTRQWTSLMSSPVYYPDSLSRFPDSVAAVFRAFAAADGGVLFFCREGVDHTGLIASLLLKLVGVRDEVIADAEGIARYGKPDAEGIGFPGGSIGGLVGTRAPLLEFLQDLDVEALLLDEGVTRDELEAIRARFLR